MRETKRPSWMEFWRAQTRREVESLADARAQPGGTAGLRRERAENLKILRRRRNCVETAPHDEFASVRPRDHTPLPATLLVVAHPNRATRQYGSRGKRVARSHRRRARGRIETQIRQFAAHAVIDED